MLPRGNRSHSAFRRPHKEALLDQVGLVDVFDGFGWLAHADRQRLESDRSALKHLTDRHQHGPGRLVESTMINAKELEPISSNVFIDRGVSFHCREVSHLAKQPI